MNAQVFVPPYARPIQEVGFLPLLVPFIPEILVGAGILTAGVAGYELGKPSVDAAGNRIPGVVEVAATQVGKGIGNALIISAVIVTGYLLLTRGKK